MAPSAVRIRTGTTGRTKRVSVDGIDLATARERLRALEEGTKGSPKGRAKA